MIGADTRTDRHDVRVRPWPAAIVLAAAPFLVLFDSLAVATALPAIGAELGLRPGLLQWVVTLQSLRIGALLVLGGRAADLWGRRRVLVASLGLSAAAGLPVGIAPGPAPLLAGRALQGVAAAFALPAALASAATVFPQEPWRSRAFAVVAVAANAAGLGGTILGGLVAATLGWRWVFLVTVPVGLLAAVAAASFLPPDQPATSAAGRLDVGGALLLVAGQAALILGLTEAGKAGPTSPAAVGAVGGAVVLLAGLVVLEGRVGDPLIKPRLVRSRRLVGSCLAFGAHAAAYAAVVVVGSLYLQDRHGLSSAGAGMALAPVLAAAIVSAVPSGFLLRRWGARRVVAAALALCAITLAMVARASGGSLGAVLPWLVAWGLSAGPIYVGLTTECIGDADPEDRGTASALFESTSHIGGAIAVATYLTVLGAGLDYALVQLGGAAAAGAAAIATLRILPATRPAPRSDR